MRRATLAKGPTSVIQGQIVSVSQDGNGITLNNGMKAYYSKFKTLPRFPVGTGIQATVEAYGDKGTLYIQEIEPIGSAPIPQQMQPSNGYGQVPQQPPQGYGPPQTYVPSVPAPEYPMPRSTTYETLPHSKDVLIIRQACLHAATRFLAMKADVDDESSVLQVAQRFENWVLDPKSHMDPQQLEFPTVEATEEIPF